ncbi:MAG: hypothetical protein EA446_00370 [Nitrosopumilus sp.]|nr:MAG: hypothetical protein EA446_00370 [Nitrosopumilus sp.]
MDLLKDKRKKMKKDIEYALRKEDKILHDENEEPVTYVDEEDVKSIEHQEHVEHDENEEPVTFVKKSENENL